MRLSRIDRTNNHVAYVSADVRLNSWRRTMHMIRIKKSLINDVLVNDNSHTCIDVRPFIARRVLRPNYCPEALQRRQTNIATKYNLVSHFWE